MPDRSPLRAVLVDVGGTLWADGPPAPGEVRGPRSTALLRELPGINSALAVRLADELERASNEAVDAEERVADTRQRTAEVLEKVTAELGIDPKLAPAIRRAIASAIGAYVTSYDVGVRKPHPAMFRAALEALDREPRECVFIGNSERADMEPATGLRMRAIRVAIEEPLPEVSAADAVTDSLAEVATLLRSWV